MLIFLSELPEEESNKSNGEGENNDVIEINSATLKSESIDSTVLHKPPVQTKDKKQRKARSKSRDKKKPQEFNNQELEALRNNFAKTQGVKGVLVEPFKPLKTEENIKEDVNINLDKDKVLAIEEDKTEKQTEPAVKKSVEESLYEPVGAEREEFVKNKLSQSNKEDEDVKPSDDNIIGFDLKPNEVILNGSQDQTNGLNSAPKIPERKKNSSRQSLNRVSIVENEKTEKKEKKSSFIKEWQKDLKEFFSLRKKKPSTASCNNSVQEDRSVDDGKISVDNESLYLESNQDKENGKGEEEQVPQLEEVPVQEKESPGTTENPVEKRSKKRKNRRKTNSETFETNPFKSSEVKKDDQETEKAEDKFETENDEEKNLSLKPKVVVPSPLGKL